MSKRDVKIDDRQLSFYLQQGAATPAPGSLAIGPRLRHAASRACDAYHARTGRERIDICAELYKLTGVEVSKSSLDSWTAESRDRSSDGIDHCGNKRWGMPAELVPAFCQVTGEWELLFIQAEAGNFKALKGKDVVRARMGLLKEEILKKTHELKDLEKAMVETEG